MTEAKGDIKAFYDQTAQILRQSYKVPFNPEAIEQLNTATREIRKIINDIVSQVKIAPVGIVMNSPERDYLPEYTPGDSDIISRFNMVVNGTDRAKIQTIETIKKHVMELAEPIARAITALNAMDEATGTAPSIAELLPKEYAREYRKISRIATAAPTYCDMCGKPITARDIDLSAEYCPNHGYMCDECRLKYLNEFRQHYVNDINKIIEENKAGKSAAK